MAHRAPGARSTGVRPTLYMTLGLPASGKSTWARELMATRPKGSVARINKDDLRAMLHNDAWDGPATEVHIETARDALVTAALLDGADVIVDDTNGAPRHETRLRQLAALYGADFEVKSFMDVDLHECIRRDAARTGRAHVGEKAVRDVHAQFRGRKGAVEPLRPQPYKADPALPTVSIFDVDGTLALTGARNIFDESRVSRDLPNEPVVAIARMILDNGGDIVVMSGRSDACRQDTQAWLDKHVAPGLPLFMRTSGDKRQDMFVKFDLFTAHIAGKYGVDMVFDDRDQVVLLWRRILGLNCFQVAEGRF